jgi:uracil-DNA glycosylase
MPALSAKEWLWPSNLLRARLFCSYHPSQQNTQTGRLTPEMFQQVLCDIGDFLAC